MDEVYKPDSERLEKQVLVLSCATCENDTAYFILTGDPICTRCDKDFFKKKKESKVLVRTITPTATSYEN